MLNDDNSKAANAKLSLRCFQQGFNVFRHIAWIVSNLLQPNILHSM